MKYFVYLVFCCAGCVPAPKDVPAPIDTSAGIEDTQDTEDTEDTDTDSDSGLTDEDGDGFYVEEGDCNDDPDNGGIWQNPGWDEDPYNDIDDDCDGRTDEVFSGLLISQGSTGMVGSASLLRLNDLGDYLGGSGISGGAHPYRMRENRTDGGWTVFQSGSAEVGPAVYQMTPEGESTLIVDFYQNIKDEQLDQVPSGAAYHPSGYFLVAATDSVLKVEMDGSWEVLLTFNLDPKKGPFDMAPQDIVIDPFTEEAFIIGWLGGIANWNEEEGYRLQIPGDLEAPAFECNDLQIRDGGGVYMFGTDLNEGDYGVFRYNETKKTIVLKAEWTYSDFTPDGFTIESESGDFYVTAHGGWYQYVFRMVGDGSYIGQLYTTFPNGDQNDAFRRYWTIGVLWDED